MELRIWPTSRTLYGAMTLSQIILMKVISAHVDVYPTGFHAFDMLLPFRKISRQAIEAFEKQYLYAVEHYHFVQNN